MVGRRLFPAEASRKASGGDARLFHGNFVDDCPGFLAGALPAGETLGLHPGVEAFIADPATVGVEVRDVEFVSEFVFHKSSLQPGSDNHRLSVPRVAQPEYPLLREHG